MNVSMLSGSTSEKYRVALGDVIVLEPEEMIQLDSQTDSGAHGHIDLLTLYRARDAEGA